MRRKANAFSWRQDDEWSEPKALETGVNTPDDFENFVVFSPDGSEIHFVRGFQLYWRVSTETAGRRVDRRQRRRTEASRRAQASARS
jgi:hypothetical protein